jgi:hypothetical protein
MAKIEGMALNMVLALAKAELMDACRTHNVEIKGVGFDPEYTDYDEEGERTLTVVAHIEAEEKCFKNDCGTHPWIMVWDEETCSFNSLMRIDQKEDNPSGEN